MFIVHSSTREIIWDLKQIDGLRSRSSTRQLTSRLVLQSTIQIKTMSKCSSSKMAKKLWSSPRKSTSILKITCPVPKKYQKRNLTTQIKTVKPLNLYRTIQRATLVRTIGEGIIVRDRSKDRVTQQLFWRILKTWSLLGTNAKTLEEKIVWINSQSLLLTYSRAQ